MTIEVSLYWPFKENTSNHCIWKRKQPKVKAAIISDYIYHFIISDYSIIVKWLTDQYWPWHLCKSSWNVEKEVRGKGGTWPKHFIISDYSIIVKWLTDQYWPKHLCKSSWYVEKEARKGSNWLCGKRGKGLWKGGTDPNISLF